MSTPSPEGMLPGVLGSNAVMISNSYRITALLGEGGFAKVYRAHPTGGGADVAIKVLADPDPPQDVLQRLEEEARIMRLANDQALVNVDRVHRLSDRWAVVMEFVPGANCRQLVERLGPLPARVALEIVGEVARALDRVYHQPGPEGAPLGLLHRDLKPSNLQVTRRGQVKVLDFGGAALEAPDGLPISKVHGTYGYIAPERLRGEESPAVDTFALGMVLYRLLTAEPTNRKQLADLASRMRGARGFGLQLAAEMCALEPQDRPRLAEVATRCQGLVQRMDGPSLQEWAPVHVPAQHERTDDPLCGKVLRTTAPTPPPAAPRPIVRQRSPWRSLLARLRRQLRFVPALVVVGVLGAGMWAAATLIGPAVVEWREAARPEPNPGLDPTTEAMPAPSD